jgi:hypothetical protein
MRTRHPALYDWFLNALAGALVVTLIVNTVTGLIAVARVITGNPLPIEFIVIADALAAVVGAAYGTMDWIQGRTDQ